MSSFKIDKYFKMDLMLLGLSYFNHQFSFEFLHITSSKCLTHLKSYVSQQKKGLSSCKRVNPKKSMARIQQKKKNSLELQTCQNFHSS